MAVAYTQKRVDAPGSARINFGTVTPDSSYVTGGYAFTPASFGFASAVLAVVFTPRTGVTAVIDRTNQKIKLVTPGVQTIKQFRAAGSDATTSAAYTITGALASDTLVSILAFENDGTEVANLTASGTTVLTADTATITTGTDSSGFDLVFTLSRGDNSVVEVASTSNQSASIQEYVAFGY
jgi:hypothetical protein